MKKKYEQDDMFRLISESYELGLSPVDYCRTKNFPVKVFYRWRQRYVAIYGSSPMPLAPQVTNDQPSFIALDMAASPGLCLELGTHIRLRFDSLPDPRYLSELLKNLPHASFK